MAYRVVAIPEEHLKEIEGIEGVDLIERPEQDRFGPGAPSSSVKKLINTEYGQAWVFIWESEDGKLGGRVITGTNANTGEEQTWEINGIPVTVSKEWDEGAPGEIEMFTWGGLRRKDRRGWDPRGNEGTESQNRKVIEAVKPEIEKLFTPEVREQAHKCHMRSKQFHLRHKFADEAERIEKRLNELAERLNEVTP